MPFISMIMTNDICINLNPSKINDTTKTFVSKNELLSCRYCIFVIYCHVLLFLVIHGHLWNFLLFLVGSCHLLSFCS